MKYSNNALEVVHREVTAQWEICPNPNVLGATLLVMLRNFPLCEVEGHVALILVLQSHPSLLQPERTANGCPFLRVGVDAIYTCNKQWAGAVEGWITNNGVPTESRNEVTR